MAKPKLHELLAVESDAEGVAKNVSREAIVTFTKRVEHFSGHHRTLKLFEDTGEDMSAHEQRKELDTTVADKLSYMEGQLSKYWDVVYQKERANQTAVADIVVEGKTIATNVPATYLLGLEKKLQQYREVCFNIPTLSPGINWVPDPSIGVNVYRAEPPEKNFKTAKDFRHRVLYEATERHPAQIEKWEETKNVGVYTRNVWSGMMSTSDESELLDRIDMLIRAVKQARRRANGVEVETDKIASKLFDFIHTS